MAITVKSRKKVMWRAYWPRLTLTRRVEQEGGAIGTIVSFSSLMSRHVTHVYHVMCHVYHVTCHECHV